MDVKKFVCPECATVFDASANPCPVCGFIHGVDDNPMGHDERYPNVRLVNLTPHAINLVFPDFPEVPVVTIPSSGVARCTQIDIPVTSINAAGRVISVTMSQFGDVVGLPAPEDGVMFIVSKVVKAAIPDRSDVVTPGNQVRDEAGRVIGCSSLTL